MNTRTIIFFNDTATTEIYTLSLHDALPIFRLPARQHGHDAGGALPARPPVRHRRRGRQHPHRRGAHAAHQDRKSTRLNSSHANISYAVFCLKKKKYRTTRYTSIGDKTSHTQ